MLREQSGSGDQTRERRNSLRHPVPPGVNASIQVPSGRTDLVTVGDISRTVACVVRRGSLELFANDEVFLNLSDYKLFQNVYLPACVKWINTLRHKTLVGLAFKNGPLLPGSILDQYLDRALMVPESGDA
ncbi:PilZ domain-containing protein [Synechococcus sp. BA-132 BA5]|uniref:PilZ domain-containing protein n=1 Tax=Synechococcus sp. BA-132 BA5 TaxID=3110252 RepID=UPI003FCE6B38